MQFGYTIHDNDTDTSITSQDTEELKRFAVACSNGKSHLSVISLIEPDEAISDGTWKALTSLLRQNYGISVERWTA